MRKQNSILRKLLQESKINNNILKRRDRIKTSEIQDLLYERDLRLNQWRNLQTLHREYKRLADARLHYYIRERTRLLGSNLNISEEWRELDHQLSWVETRENELKQTWDTYMENCERATLWKNGRKYRPVIIPREEENRNLEDRRAERRGRRTLPNK